MKERLIKISMEHPKIVTVAMVLSTLILGLLMFGVKVDTDPENMLSEDEPMRMFHNRVKKEFGLHDVVVVGIVNEKHPDGVFNVQTLSRVHELTQFAKTLEDSRHPEKRVVTKDVIAPGTVDTILQAGLGQVRFEWMMQQPPKTREEALKLRDNAMSNPLFKGTMVSEDGKALAMYLPITDKDFAYPLRKRLIEKIETFDGDDDFHITGLPVAEDTFGVEMFVQMALSAPLAMLAIFILMLLFFKNIRLIISPMIIAMASVITTMGLLIGTGNTVHIMSSMIPIFLMPIAVVDSIHILSEFFDRYGKTGDRKKTLSEVLNHLFTPMLYTSLTSSAGFLSLALTPIPPVRVFGIFVAIGIMTAWFLTITFIPAYVMMLSENGLKNLGAAGEGIKNSRRGFLSRQLNAMGRLTYVRAKLIVISGVIICGIAGWGISKIQINDNPVRWFHEDHDIRVADRVLNSHFGGTYEAYLVLEGDGEAPRVADIAGVITDAVESGLENENKTVVGEMTKLVDETSKAAVDPDVFFKTLVARLEERMDAASDADYEIWAQGIDAAERIKNEGLIFKRPDVLNYIGALQADLASSGVIGKSNSVTDLVKKVHQELFEGKKAHFSIPETQNAVAQVLITFQNSHKPDTLFHLVTPDYKKANIWVQLKNGDNKDMEAAVKRAEQFMAKNPPPVPLVQKWAGLTYLNVVWQDKMVTGMLNSFMGSFVVVLIMMAVLFRSVLWGLLAMVPLSITIAFIYGVIGIVGKDYDMPVAVLSSLTLGLAVDFAIHFLERSRSEYRKAGSWAKAVERMFEEPARAISRNVIVIAVGFTPLLVAPLVPYQTVGVFLASIMAVSGLGTMLLLPALIRLLENRLFKVKHGVDAQVPEAA